MRRRLAEVFGVGEATSPDEVERQINTAQSLVHRAVPTKRDRGYTPTTAKAQSDLDSAQSLVRKEKRNSGRSFPTTNRFMNEPAVELGDDDIEPAGPPPIPKAALKKAKRPLAPHLPAPKSAAVKLPKAQKPSAPTTNWDTDLDFDNDFPDLPAPRSANVDIGPGEDDYKSPFSAIGFGGSSWDTTPDWMRDPEKMPRAGGGSQRIPQEPKAAPLPYRGPAPVGRQWTDKDVKKATKKPGVLSRVFGRRKA
jgi:hypothetical protein